MTAEIGEMARMGVIGGRSEREGMYICLHTADSLHCIAETNTTLESSYTTLKKQNKKKTELTNTENKWVVARDGE